MNRPTKTAVKIAGIALALGGLAGGLAGCGGSDSDGDGGSAADAPKGASKDGFCEKFNGLYDNLLQSDPKDTSAAIKGIKDWAGEMEDYGTPSEMSDDARDGFEVVIATFKGVDEDASLADIQNLGDDVSEADNKLAEAFGDWTQENCPAPEVPDLPSDSAS
jgi:hypothetical protein